MQAKYSAEISPCQPSNLYRRVACLQKLLQRLLASVLPFASSRFPKRAGPGGAGGPSARFFTGSLPPLDTQSKEPNYSELPDQHRRREPVHVEVLLLGEEREVFGPRPPVVQVPLRRGQQPVAGDAASSDDRVGPVEALQQGLDHCRGHRGRRRRFYTMGHDGLVRLLGAHRRCGHR